MPKRKRSSAVYNTDLDDAGQLKAKKRNFHKWSGKLKSEAIATSSQTVDDIFTADPYTLPQRAIQAQQEVVRQKIHYGKVVVQRALKKARGFERQKIAKRIKNAKRELELQPGGEQEQVLKRLERELEILKRLEVVTLTRNHVEKVLGKQKRIITSVFWPGFVKGNNGIEDGKVCDGGADNEAKEMNVVQNNVVARLYNSNPMKEAMGVMLKLVKGAIGIRNEESGSPKVGGKHAGLTKDAEASKSNGGDDGAGNEEEDGEREEGLKKGVYNKETSSKEEFDHHEEEEFLGFSEVETQELEIKVKDKSFVDGKPSSSTERYPSIKPVDPSRSSGDEWSGEEDELPSGENEDEADGEFWGDEDEDEDPPEDVDEDELMDVYSRFLAPNSDEEDDGERSEGEYILPVSVTPPTSSRRKTASSSSESYPLQNSSRKPKPLQVDNHKYEGKETRNLETQAKTPSSNAIAATRPMIISSTFLPTLYTGYISGSDSGSDSNKKNPTSRTQKKKIRNELDNDPFKTRKNRMGQRARQALWEKKYGKAANHLRKVAATVAGEIQEKEKKRGGGEGMRPRNTRDRVKTNGNGYRNGDENDSSNGTRLLPAQPLQQDNIHNHQGQQWQQKQQHIPKTVTGLEHPSWEAARRQKGTESLNNVVFVGKKIRFEKED